MGFFRADGSVPLIGIKRRRAVPEDASAFAFQVLELARIERPGEDRKQRQHQQHREGDQQVQDIHRRQRASRIELITTNSELAAMPRPAAHGGRRPNSASGTQQAL